MTREDFQPNNTESLTKNKLKPNISRETPDRNVINALMKVPGMHKGVAYILDVITKVATTFPTKPVDIRDS